MKDNNERAVSNRPEGLTVVDQAVFRRLSSTAREGSRFRQHLNLHQSYDEVCQRLLNAVEPESYIRPHRHECPSQKETLLVMQGSVALLIFNDNGTIEYSETFGEDCGSKLMEIDSMIWHTVLALEPNTILFEVKQGPFVEARAKCLASWAPHEGTQEAIEYHAGLLASIKK